MAEVALRPIDDSDLDALFEQMRDPESVRMAAFTAENPDDRTAFDVHMAKIRTLPEATTRAVTVDGRLVGSIASRDACIAQPVAAGSRRAHRDCADCRRHLLRDPSRAEN